MFNKKNHIGRPSNEELRNRKIKKIITVAAPVFVVAMIVVAVITGNLTGLMGNSVSYYCADSSYTPDIKNNRCIKKIDSILLGDFNFDGKVTTDNT